MIYPPYTLLNLVLLSVYDIYIYSSISFPTYSPVGADFVRLDVIHQQ